MNGGELHASSEQEDMYAAIDILVDKLARQLNNIKISETTLEALVAVITQQRFYTRYIARYRWIFIPTGIWRKQRLSERWDDQRSSIAIKLGTQYREHQKLRTLLK